MSNNGPKMVKEDWAPGFYIKHFIKDMRIAVEEADQARGGIARAQAGAEHLRAPAGNRGGRPGNPGHHQGLPVRTQRKSAHSNVSGAALFQIKPGEQTA